MDHSRNDSAGPALRGYRLQILYTLARLIEPRTALQAALWPEGIEDLAIFDQRGTLREAIQIKAHSAPMTLSELVSKRGTGLLERAVDTARQHPESQVHLLSFGPFGQELRDAWDGSPASRERVVRKLKKAGLSPADIALLFERLTLERADEDTKRAKVDRFLANTPTLAGQSEHAAAILCQWLYGAAERCERVIQADLIARLAHVGRYLHARAGYWRDWFIVSFTRPLGGATYAPAPGSMAVRRRPVRGRSDRTDRAPGPPLPHRPGSPRSPRRRSAHPGGPHSGRPWPRPRATA